MRRRDLIIGALACGCFPRSVLARGQLYQVGCYVSAGKNSDVQAPVDYGYAETTGVAEYDATVRGALAEVAAVMGRPVGATLKFMSDYNAHANPSPPMTIAFGKQLLDELYAGGDFPLKVTCIAAHEVAHLLQFEDGYFDIALTDATVRRNELMADAFAGACLAFIVNGGQKIDRGVLEAKRDSVQAAFQLMFKLGDDYFNSPDHHGTSQERLDAVDSGYTFSNEIASGGPLSGDISKDIMDKARINAVR